MYATVRTTFDEVKLYAEKSGKCACGKRRTRSQKFYQTLNPWNKNAAGNVKSRSEIYDELKVAIAAWKAKPITCEVCK